MRIRMRILCLGIVLFFLSGAFFGCASSQKKANEYPGLFPGSKANIRYEIAPEAEITMAKYYMAPWKGKDYLHFEIEIKNISKEKHRYRVAVLLDEGPGIAGLYPRKVKKGKTVEPGKTHKGKLPMYYDKEPKGILVKVEVFD